MTNQKKKRGPPPKGSRPTPQRTRPVFVTPMAAQVVKRLPEGDEWIYELKFDGYRALILKDHDRVEIRSRKNKILTKMYPRVAAAGLKLNADQAFVDGEIVALDLQGRPSFQALQRRGSHPDNQIVFYAFDLLYLDGKDRTDEPLLKRRARLLKVLGGSELLLSKELPGSPAAIVEAVRGLGLEGVVAKRKDSMYEPGERSGAWQKLKLENQQEFVIGGYRAGSNGVDALLVGYHDDSGLRFAGKVRAGFVPHLRREVAKTLKPLHIDHCPFVDLPNSTSDRWGGGVTADEMREMQWVSPELVAQVRFGHFHRQRRTHYDHLRQPHSFHSDRYQRQGYGGVHGVRGRGRYFHGQRRAHYDHRQ
jgi:bifunctional non-homologous end joining protein LigD